MDTWEEVENLPKEYFKKLREIQKEFGDGLSQVLTNHFNYVIKKYSNWNRYPRKVKKMLKKEKFWKLKNSEFLKRDDVKVLWNF